MTAKNRNYLFYLEDMLNSMIRIDLENLIRTEFNNPSPDTPDILKPPRF